jgi:hypothetical protein
MSSEADAFFATVMAEFGPVASELGLVLNRN